jgi:4-amino-4-deoxy-L-arabinose transferase-like glycosyltransferase
MNLAADYANKFNLYIANFRELFTIFMKSYLFTVYILALPAIILLTIALPVFYKRKTIFPKILSVYRNEKIFLIIFLLSSLLIILSIHFFVMLDYPMTTDENSYLFQADLLASGKLYADSPPLPHFFIYDNMLCDGKWRSKYTIGWPVLLAIGQIFHVRWIIGPLCTVFSLLFIYLITKKIFGRKAGLVAMLFALFSPLFILTGSSYLTHTVFGLMLLIFVYSLLNIEKNGKSIFPISAGISLMLAVNIRPVDTVVLMASSALLILYIFFKSQNRSLIIKKLIPIALFFIAGLGVILSINYLQNGNPLSFGYSIYNPKDMWGFGKNGHDFMSSLWNLTFTILRTSFWTVPSLILLGLFSFTGKKPIVFCLSAIITSFVILNMGLNSTGMVSFGTRYYYIPWLILVILASGGLIYLSAITSRRKLFCGKLFLNISVTTIILYMTFGVNTVILPEIRNMYLNNSFLKNSALNPPQLQGKNLIFLLNSPGKVNTELTFNNWNYKEQNNLLVHFLMPEENQQLIDSFKDRKPYMEYWDFNQNKFVVIPYPENPNTSNYLLHAGMNYSLLLQPAQVKKAEDAYKKALEISPNCFPIMFKLGAFYLENGSYDKAVRMFHDISKMYPQYQEVYYFLGISTGKAGNTKEASQILEKFISECPQSPYRDKGIDWYLYYKNLK